MKRYLIATESTAESLSRGPKDQIKTFDASKESEATAYVGSILTSKARKLVAVTLYDFVSHETEPLTPVLKEGRLALVKVSEA